MSRVTPPLLPVFAGLPEPRQARGRRHPLAAILALSCAAMLAGCDSLLAIAESGRDPHAGAPLVQRLGFTRARTPCVATLHRVFRRLDVAAFETAVGQWAAQVSAVVERGTPPTGLAIDGKVLRGSRQPAVPAVQLLGALGHELGLVLAEVPVDPATGEVGALPASWPSWCWTVDAACPERPVAEAIVAKGGPI